MTYARFTKLRGAVAAMLILAGATAQVATASAAHAAYGFAGDQIAAKAESYPVGYNGGQCKVWAQAVVNSVLAANNISARVGGFGSPGGAYYGAYANAGGTLVDASAARPGDLVQIVKASERTSDYPSGRLHTTIIVGMTNTSGTFTVRDSNWGQDGKVQQHTFDPVAWAQAGGSTAYFWRFGTAGATGGSGSIADGSFVSYQGNVYRIAGGAPLYVSSWSVYGGAQPTTPLTAAQWVSLRSVPVNGTDIVAQGVGTVYRIAGGAPLVVTTCAIGTTNFCSDAIAVDPYAISHLDHLNPVPSSGTDLALAVYSGGTGSVYRVAGGAPLIVTACTVGTTNFCADAVPIDPYALGHLDHLNAVPANGTDVALALSSGGTGTVYRIAGGALFAVSTCTVGATSFCGDTVTIDPYSTGHLDHLRAQPAAGTTVRSIPSSAWWYFNSECRRAISSTSGAVTVTDSSLDAHVVCHTASLAHTQSASRVSLGKPVTLSTTVMDTTTHKRLGSITVQLQRRTSTSWVDVKGVLTNKTGSASVRAVPPATRTYRWHMRARRTTRAYYKATASGSFRVTVSR